MEYLTKGLKSVLGTPDAANELPTGADTVERLVDRLQSSSLLDDRRDACRALKALSRTYRVEVGAQGMDSLRQVLEMDRTDGEIIGLALDTLFNITSPEMFDNEIDESHNKGINNKIGEQFTEIFIKQQDTVGLILSSLEDFDFRIRWPALKLLTNLVANRLKDMQEIILIMPMGVSRLMDLLSDSREVIRNDALLLLIQLTRGNANIQKIVAFENAFDRLFDVIKQEGGAQGGIIVEDCLLLMLNLLKGNFSNQVFFKEGSYIQRLTPLFNQLPPDHDEDDETPMATWSPQKVSNVHCMVLVIRAIVAPSCPAQMISACQLTMHKCGLLQSLCDILMVSGVPADVLTETINAVAEVIRGNAVNQEFLSSVMAPSSPPRPAIVVLLMSMVNEKQPFELRCAVLYCFQCYLYKNETGQMQLIQTLLPQSNETQSLTTGQLLCGGLFSTDPLSNWFSAVALSHALIDNSQQQREQLLRVLLATNIGKSPVTLMQQCVMLLQQQQNNNNKPQCKLGLLMLLCRWTAYCPVAVKAFLNIDSSVTSLTASLSAHENNDDLCETLIQSMCAMLLGMCVHFNDTRDNDDDVKYTKEQLCNLIEKRIGFERFQNALGGITRNEIYSRTLKHPQPAAKTPIDLLLDHEFCRLLKALESTILESVLKINNSQLHSGVNDSNNFTVETSGDSSSSLMISQYKELIREQDGQIQKLNRLNENFIQEISQLKNHVEELNVEINNLKDQNIVLRAAQINHNNVTLNSDNNKEKYESMINELEMQLKNCHLRINELENKSTEENSESHYKKLYEEKSIELDKLKKDQDDLLELLAYEDTKLNAYKAKLTALGEKVDTDESSGEIDTDDQPESSN
ncbi:hypothetical protein PV327_010719 [Microctonus hyperodae]|uniref:Vesicle tethering protein Uso1/P115-like head domain-containing protein n=1 Tax=Microctonus hyperodae TaxID=165561 RepID=A0AA39C808_MICHY|nr:hypothetical protein PV327_010719 [Microctonus hyperodae]